MTHRFPHDFWAEQDLQNLDLQSGFRFDASSPHGLGRRGPYGFSRGVDWSALASEPREELLGHFIDETMLDDVEFDDEPIDEGPYGGLVNDLHPAAASTGLFIPEKYEPNYAYPLILWLHDAGGDESDLLTLMPRVSERNYFGLSLRGPASIGNSQTAGFDWRLDAESLARLEQEIYQTVCQLRRNFHIHSERVFLAGMGTGATTALRLLLNRVEWFAGAFAIGGELPEFDPKAMVHPDLPDRRVFVASSPLDEQPQVRLWRAAGLNLRSQTDDAADFNNERFGQLDHWLMESICAPV